MRLPYDIGRLPSNIFENDSLNGVSAAQWKTYITTCARPCMYNLIPKQNYRCLVLLSEIVVAISSPAQIAVRASQPILTVTVNYHMCLHIPDIISEFGPPNSNWCFAFERMNGVLAGTPNSNRSIELEVTNRFVRDFSFSSTNLPNVDIMAIPVNIKELTCTQEDSETKPSSYPLTYLVFTVLNASDPEDRFEHQLMVDRGDVEDDWPVQLLHPCQRNLKMNGSFLNEVTTFLEGLYGNQLEYVRPRINKYGRCVVNGQKFSSIFNSTDRGSAVKAMFVDTGNELVPFFGIVRYYFTVTAVVCKHPRLHYLSYVTWLKLKSDHPEPQSKLFVTLRNFYQSDRIISPRRFLCRCVLVPANVNGTSHFVSELLK